MPILPELIKSIFKYVLITCFCLINCSFQTIPNLAVGSQAPDFTIEQDNNNKLTLSSLKGAIVLVEFWASWDLPSRKNHLELVRVYQKYKDKKFVNAKKFHVVSISIDQKPELYRTAIARENLPWQTHACDFNGWYGNIVTQYKVSNIPANFLLDAQGKIIATNLFYGDIEDALVKLFPVK